MVDILCRATSPGVRGDNGISSIGAREGEAAPSADVVRDQPDDDEVRRPPLMGVVDYREYNC
jgi:hypothetical protein